MSVTFELEGFEPISRIGGGGFGDVWLARQTNVDRQVAIKVGHSAIEDETIRLRFDRECKALGRLSGHSNIVDVYTAGSLKDGRPYLVLEYINGGTLWQRLKKSPIPEPELVAIGGQMAAALTEAHASGVLHRDLKPENILIRSTGEAVLGDFGIARLHDGANTTSAAITASVAYAAPEILSGKRATVASDLYGIGVCLLAAVFRSVPFVQKTDESIHPIINRVLSDNPPDVRRHGVSETLASIIDSLLAKDPAKRPASAADVLNQFRAMQVAPAPVGGGDVGATQVVATPAISSPQGPRPSGAPAAPRPEDATPGLLQQPGQQLASAEHQRQAPIQSLPAHNQYDPAGQYGGAGLGGQQIHTPLAIVKEPTSSLKLFGLAYLATMVIGGLALFVVSLLLGGDPETEESTESLPTTSVVEAQPVGQTAGGEAEAEEEVGNDGGLLQDPDSELSIPLTVADTSFGDDAQTTDDSFGPGAGTLCDNSPATEGLVAWRGQVISTDLGSRSLYQVVSRFETEEQASQYLDAYAETNDCQSWELPTEEGDAVTYSAQQTAPPSIGERARRFVVVGDLASSQDLAIYARVLLIQSGTDVLSLNLSAVSEEEVAELDELAPLAVERLGFTS